MKYEVVKRARRLLPERAGKPWDAKEDADLIAAYEARTSLRKLSQKHQRTRGAIRARLIKLGKISTINKNEITDNVESG